MLVPSRRAFIGSSLAGLTTAGGLWAQDKKATTETEKELPSKKLVPEQFAFQPSTLFLTWHKDPTTTMTVQWVGTRGETADNKVYYTSDKNLTLPKTERKDVPENKSTWLIQDTIAKTYHPATDFKVFRAVLVGLAPGTDYYFKIGKNSPTYRFKTMPAKATNTIHFISGGDSGINPAAVANNIQAARQDPMFAVVGGDLGYDNGRAVDVSLAYLVNYSKHMVDRDGRLIPLVACIGNHEVDGGFSKTREKAPFFYSLFDGLYPDTGYASLDFGDYLSLVLLDTGHTTPIAGAQTDWLEQTLRARQDHPNVLVVNHVPAYPSYRNPIGTPATDTKQATLGTGEGNRKHWVPLFDKYRVPLVLEHHDHTFKRTKPLIAGLQNDNGVLYLGDGSWGRIRSPRKADKLNVLAKTSEDYHLSLHRIEGEERTHLAMDERGKIMDVCHTGQRKMGIVGVTG